MKRRNGEGSWGIKNIGKNKYHYFRDSNGKYTYGEDAFFRFYSNHIQYDESIAFHSILH